MTDDNNELNQVNSHVSDEDVIDVIKRLQPIDESSKSMTKKIPVMEVFGPTVQGEGFLIGNPTFFIRTGLCDYRCQRCDSLHAVLPELVKPRAMWITVPQLVVLLDQAMRDFPTPIITLSGGNPCMHDLSILFEANNRNLIGGLRRSFALETQGTLWQDWVRQCMFVTVSPKGPGMEEPHGFEADKFEAFITELASTPNMNWCVKVPVFDQRDLELVVSINQKWPMTRPRTYISVGNNIPPPPAHRNAEGEISLEEFRRIATDNYEQITRMVYNDRRLTGISMLPQLHTWLWGNEACR